MLKRFIYIAVFYNIFYNTLKAKAPINENLAKAQFCKNRLRSFAFELCFNLILYETYAYNQAFPDNALFYSLKI